MNKVAIVGIHTSIGKTVASAILCETLKADYWKPVQAGGGLLEPTDSGFVKKLVKNKGTVVHREAYRLSQAMSPHAAARHDGIKIDLKKIVIPKTKNKLIVETAGGLMSPLNDKQTNLDLVMHLNLPVIIVSQNYLGSINHTMLTIDVLKSNKVKIAGILFNGHENSETEKFILDNSKVKFIGRLIPMTRRFTKKMIRGEAARLKNSLTKIF